MNSKLHGFKNRCDLHFYECVWVEVSTLNGENLLIGNHNFPPDALPTTIVNYFSFLESKLDTINYGIILLGDFNTPSFNWECRLPLPKCCYYSTLNRDALYTSTCFLDVALIIDFAHCYSLLHHVFTKFDISGATFADVGMGKTGMYRRPMVIYMDLLGHEFT
jgi:hypothetical protein